jgi:hypothetical protein
MPDWWEVNPNTSLTFTPDTSVKTQGYYDTVKANNPTMYETIKNQDPKYIAEQQAASKDKALQDAIAAAGAGSTDTVAPTVVDPGAALQRFNESLGSGFESRLLPDTLDDPFIDRTITSGRNKADAFIENMLKRGTLTTSGRSGAINALDKQSGSVRSRLNELGNVLLGNDRGRLTNLANTKRQLASDPSFDPMAAINDITTTGQGYAGTFGDRFASSLPPGDLFDTSGLSTAGGAVTGPQNISFDPYAQSGGTLKTGLGDQISTPPSTKKRTTAVF